MRHEDFRAHFHELVDGGLSEAQRRELEAHADACSDCGRELRALREIVAAAQALPRSIEPPRDLWPGIETAIGRAAPVHARVQRAPHGWRGWFATPAVPRWAAAGAMALLVIAIFSLGRDLDRNRSAAPDGGASNSTAPFPAAVSGLELQCRGAGQLLQASLRLPVGPGTRAAATSLADGLISGLSILDRSIDETRQALAADPDNPALQRMLTARYQQKLALLHAALLRVETT